MVVLLITKVTQNDTRMYSRDMYIDDVLSLNNSRVSNRNGFWLIFSFCTQKTNCDCHISMPEPQYVQFVWKDQYTHYLSHG